MGMTTDEALIIADEGAHAFHQTWSPALAVLAAEVRRQHAEIERLRADAERLRHNSSVVVDALWKACGDDEGIVTATIASQGELR